MARLVAALARLAKSRLAVARRPLATLGAPLGCALCSLRQAHDIAMIEERQHHRLFQETATTARLAWDTDGTGGQPDRSGRCRRPALRRIKRAEPEPPKGARRSGERAMASERK